VAQSALSLCGPDAIPEREASRRARLVRAAEAAPQWRVESPRPIVSRDNAGQSDHGGEESSLLLAPQLRGFSNFLSRQIFQAQFTRRQEYDGDAVPFIRMQTERAAAADGFIVRMPGRERSWRFVATNQGR